MRGRLPRLLALPLTAAVLVLPVTPALAQENEPNLPTTPIPEPAQPDQPPFSAPVGPQPLSKVVGAAGTSIGIMRFLPRSTDTDTILPGYGEKLPQQALFAAGLGISTARVNSEAFLSYEQSIAQACPGGISIKGNAPQAPGCVNQTALPDHPEGVSKGFNLPDNPLIDIGLLNTFANARWSPTVGACVPGPIAEARTSVASLSLLPEIPSLNALNGALEPLRSALDQLSGPLSQLGGLLPGTDGKGDNDENAAGALISVPNTMSTRSVVRLVDMPGTENKAVQSISTLQVAKLKILPGTPMSLTIGVVSQPTLTVTSTGSAETSSIEYSAPVLTVSRGGEKLYTLDASNPTASIPIGIPTDLSKLAGALDLAPDQLANLPVVGGLVETVSGGVKSLTSSDENAQSFVLNIGVLELSIAELDSEEREMTKPFSGYQLGASARMLNLEILPTEQLMSLLPDAAKEKLPSALVQVSFGEQIARAYAPTGGVVCGTKQAPPPAGGGEAPGVPDQLAYTSAAYSTVPMFWTGTGLLLAGVVMVAAYPGRRRPRGSTNGAPKPSPVPRSPEQQ